MNKYIKVNLPRTLEDFVKGNGEGVWVEVDEKTIADYDNDVAGIGYVGILANDSVYFPDLNCGAVLPFEMRGENRPVADFDGFLAKLSVISEEEKDLLLDKDRSLSGHEMRLLRKRRMKMNHQEKQLLQEYKNVGLSPAQIMYLRQERDELEQKNLQANARITELEARLSLLEEERDTAVESMSKNIAAAFKQRDAAIEDMRGICCLCKNGKPYKTVETTMMTCRHIKETATMKQPKCAHFEWRGVKDGIE